MWPWACCKPKDIWTGVSARNGPKSKKQNVKQVREDEDQVKAAAARA